MNSINHKFLLAVGVSLFALQAAADSIDIEAQPLPDALLEFSEQTDLQLAYVATLANSKTSPGTQGEREPATALKDILAGTDLEYQFVNDDTVAIGPNRSHSAKDAGHDGAAPRPEPILMAQNVTREEQTESSQDEPDDDSADADADAETGDAVVEDTLALEQVVVTGTRLSRTPSQVAANLVTLDQGMLQATGEISLDKALRTLPQNQLGASSVASYARLGGQHFNGATNLSGASAVNLRGLGNGATLVLVDGKRIGSSGLAGGVTDISGIPTASIERVEIMLDGASAIYGSDAVGGVVNIITRKDYEGAELEVMHSAPDRGGFDESALTLSGSWLWGETRMRGNVQASSHSPLYGRDRPGKYDTNNYCNKGCIRGTRNVYEYQGALYQPSQLPPGITTSSPGVTDIWLVELQPDGSLAVKVRSRDNNIGRESTVDNQSLLPEQDRMSVMLGFDHDFGATRLSAQAYYMDRTTTTDQGDARFAHFLGSGDTPTGDSPAMYWSVSGIERLSTATQEVFRVNFDLTGSVFGMEWAFGAGATNDRSDNHHTGSLYASYDPEIPPHLADQFQAYKLASVRPDYVEFIGIETFREFWSQELSSGWTNTTDWAEATLSGSWLSLPGGDARFVVGAAWRSTGLKTDNKRNSYGHNSNNGSYWTEEPGLGVRFATWDTKFVDDNVGLFAEFAALVLESLDLSAAVRWDDYNHFDSDTTYSIGAVWRPIGSVRLHSNLSTSYIIPTARDKVEDPNNFFIGQAFRCERKVDWPELGGRDDCPGEPLRLQNPDGSLATTPGESFIYFSHLVYGGNPNLLPEEGESISVGVELTPQAIPGLSLDLTWRSVDYTNKIVGSSSRSDVPHYVGVDPADVYAFIFPDPSGSDAYYADRRNVNAAAWTNEGLDLEARYDWSTDWGSWSIDALITQTSSFYKDIGDGSEPYDYVGDVEANRRIWALVPQYRGMLSVGFDSADQRWSAWLSAVHTSVVSSTYLFGGEPLKVIHDEPLYVNLSGQYQVGERFGLLSNSVLILRITNLFDDLAEHKQIKASSGELFDDGVVNAKFDDPRGRTFTLGLKMQF